METIVFSLASLVIYSSLLFTENAKARSVSHLNNFNYVHFLYRVKFWCSFNSFIQTLYQNHSTSWLGLFSFHFCEEIFWQTLTKSSTDKINQPSRAIYRSIHDFITVRSASDGLFAWWYLGKWCSQFWRKIWGYKE